MHLPKGVARQSFGVLLAAISLGAFASCPPPNSSHLNSNKPSNSKNFETTLSYKTDRSATINAATQSNGSANSTSKNIEPSKCIVEFPTNFKQSVEEKPVDWLARGLGIAGSLLGLFGAIFSIYKMRRDRKLSIEDDFWFRKILAPLTIEPILEGLAELLSDIPNTKSKNSKKKSFAIGITKKFQEFYASANALALMHPSLPSSFIDKLSRCEDILTEFASEISVDSDAEGTLTPESKLKEDVWLAMIDAMNLIKNIQKKH